MKKPTNFAARVRQTRAAVREVKSAIKKAKDEFQNLQDSLKALDAEPSPPLYAAQIVNRHALLSFEILQENIETLESELPRLRETSRLGQPVAYAPPQVKSQVTPAKASRPKTIRELARAILEENNRGMKAIEIARLAMKRGYRRKSGKRDDVQKIAEIFRIKLEKHKDEFYKDELKFYHLRSTFRPWSESASGN
jgi:hypothetical protein